MNTVKQFDFITQVSDLSVPKVMGILNVTPDSISDGGKFLQLDTALFHVEKMLREGADIIDIGGESTRPFAEEVSTEQELSRVIPVIEQIKQRFDCLISVDTSKAEVMKQAALAGANLINDVRALQLPNALSTAIELDLPVCIMHMQGEPKTMQLQPNYHNVVEEVMTWLAQRVDFCIQAGMKKERILLDPGFCFGKSLQHNYQLLKHLDRFNTLAMPLLIGVSRKSMIGNVLQKGVDERVIGSIAAALLAVERGASILRVHDVAETVEALKIWQAMQES